MRQKIKFYLPKNFCQPTTVFIAKTMSGREFQANFMECEEILFSSFHAFFNTQFNWNRLNPVNQLLHLLRMCRSKHGAIITGGGNHKKAGPQKGIPSNND